MLFSSEFRHLTPCSSGLTIPLPYLVHILMGSSGLPGALLPHRSHNRHCYPLQKGMKSLRGLSIQPGEITAKNKQTHGEDTESSVLSWVGLSLSQTILICPWRSPNLQGNSLPSLPPEAENQPPSPGTPCTSNSPSPSFSSHWLHIFLSLPLFPLPVSIDASLCFGVWCFLCFCLFFFSLSALTLLFTTFPHPILPSIFSWTTGPESLPLSALS